MMEIRKMLKMMTFARLRQEMTDDCLGDTLLLRDFSYRHKKTAGGGRRFRVGSGAGCATRVF
jgi:hypothetical protein